MLGCARSASDAGHAESHSTHVGQKRMELAVILAAGRGTRMQHSHEDANLTKEQAAVARAGVKALIPVGRPFIDYVLSSLGDAGYKRVCLVIGPHHEEL